MYIIKTEVIKQNCIREIESLPLGKWEVNIEEYKPKRTNPQNALYWKWVTIIGDFHGYSKDEMHEAFACEFLGTTKYTTIYGQEITKPVSTTSLTKQEFSEYMMKIEAHALNNDIRLPSPEHYGR